MTNRETLIQYLRDDIADTRELIDDLERGGFSHKLIMQEQDRLCKHEKKLSDLLCND